MKKFFLISSLVFVFGYAQNIEFVKNAALIYWQNGVKKIVILKNIEEMDAKIGKKRANVTLYMNSGRTIYINNISILTYKNLENTLTNASMKILKEIK